MKKRLLVEECSRLKTQVDKVEGTIKETLESVDKLQADLGEADAFKLALENWTISIEDQVSMLQRQVQELQSRVEENRITSNRIAELEVELQETVARGGEMFVEGQD